MAVSSSSVVCVTRGGVNQTHEAGTDAGWTSNEEGGSGVKGHIAPLVTGNASVCA